MIFTILGSRSWVDIEEEFLCLGRCPSGPPRPEEVRFEVERELFPILANSSKIVASKI